MSEPGPQDQPDDAAMDLLVEQVLRGLSPADQRALDEMHGAFADQYQKDLERAAAAVSLAARIDGELPAALRARLDRQALDYIAAMGPVRGVTTGGVTTGRAPSPSQPVPAAPHASSPPSGARREGNGTLGWLAAAACLVLALFGWMRSPQPVETAPVLSTVLAPPAPPPPPSAAEERSALLANGDALKITLGATKDPASAGVSGDVVWDPATQRGYMRFVGLAPNDPQARQYQVWIFDGERDQRYPVDGGVFNVPASGGDVVIPIRAALPIHKMAALAITIEKPGGVVVSSREHIVALGKAG